jgi:DNA-binding response OmpR family regulator
VILLIDDNAAHRILIRRAIRKVLPEATIQELSSLQESLRFLAENDIGPAKAMIVDMNLGDGKGTEVIKKLRELSNSPPVLLLSTSRLEEDRENALLVGADKYVVKEEDPETFLREVAEGLKAILRKEDNK